MTHEEKAKEIVERFYSLEYVESREAAKQCAVIYVEGIIGELVSPACLSGHYTVNEYQYEWWQQVKTAIEKL